MGADLDKEREALKPFLINGAPVVETAEERAMRAWFRAAREALPAPKPRAFDHLDGSDPEENRHFSRAARRMRSETWCLGVPVVPTRTMVLVTHERSQIRNRALAMAALRVALGLAVAVEEGAIQS